MDLDFSKEQELIRKSAAQFVAKECPFDLVRELEESDDGYSKTMWQKMREVGWLDLLIPETYGGFGSDFMDVVIIQEELGKRVVPSPFFSTAIIGSLAILESGSEAQKAALMPKIGDGSMLVSLAQYEEEGSYQQTGIQMVAERKNGHYELSGTKMFVTDANIADKLIVPAKADKDDDGLTLFLVDTNTPGLSVSKLQTIAKDNTCAVKFDAVQVPESDILGTIGNGWSALEKMYTKAAVAKAAEMIGACKACIDMTAGYTKERVQYGTPIGGNQAIQHFMANMLIAYDTIHEYLYRVACMIDNGEDAGLEASILKAGANENFKFISERAIQLHGAIGTTREFDIALFFRRAKSWEFVCG
ncbi:MAG: acyl-CoA/acyl-ACP dehydrogenase, partial [Proteobacteria bacterium]|nr:acyl-CoA/acyl-ACP dehydrogenase [Pseudomonadota bacterium]